MRFSIISFKIIRFKIKILPEFLEKTIANVVFVLCQGPEPGGHLVGLLRGIAALPGPVRHPLHPGQVQGGVPGAQGKVLTITSLS